MRKVAECSGQRRSSRLQAVRHAPWVAEQSVSANTSAFWRCGVFPTRGQPTRALRRPDATFGTTRFALWRSALSADAFSAELAFSTCAVKYAGHGSLRFQQQHSAINGFRCSRSEHSSATTAGATGSYRRWGYQFVQTQLRATTSLATAYSDLASWTATRRSPRVARPVRCAATSLAPCSTQQ